MISLKFFSCYSLNLHNQSNCCTVSSQGQFHSPDVFQDVMPLCELVHEMINKVFGNNAEIVMGKMVQNIYEDMLKV